MSAVETRSSSGPDAQRADAPVAALCAVEFGYEPGVPVVRSVTAQLRRGRVCALIGPNASGKSTLIKLMLGQLTPWNGTVELVGRPVGSVSHLRRARLMSYVPQTGGVSFAFTVRQVVAMGRYAAGDGDLRGPVVDRALAVCDLTDVADRVFAHLSGGQQQRVLLARAVAQSDEAGVVMLLDEPASGMDLMHVHRTMRMLRRLASGGAGASGRDGSVGRGPGVLVVLHDVNLAARYADDVWLMAGGALAAAGPCRDVMRPELLEPVYGVRFVPIEPPTARHIAPNEAGHLGGVGETGTETHDRPVFWIEPADTM